ncbi:MAG TPA: hypothetical protein PKM88_16685, partial [bacterium]|nr:hypothetical protein [bacterium]
MVVVALLMLLIGEAAAGDYVNFTNTSRINAIAANDDYVWFGCFGGLKRYNRATGTWTVYTTAEGLYDNWVNALLLRGNTLWIGTSGGLNSMAVTSGAIT